MTSALKRMVVTGKEGQVVQSLLERAKQQQMFEVIALGRPQMDLSQPEGLFDAIASVQPDIIVSAAAYTAVDQAESDEESAQVVNGLAPGKLAEAAARLNVPIVHLSTDYVFDGSKSDPYLETDTVAPLGAYGRSKLAGEQAVAAATDNHAILRTAWVYSPFGKNFLKTMLKVAESRDELNVVDDQRGNPTSALDIADAVLQVAANLLDSDSRSQRGVFHMTASGEASWADFAIEIFKQSQALNGPHAVVHRIPSSSYPTPAKRPANSRLNCTKLLDVHGVQLQDWRQSAAEIVARLIQQ
ncbi:dTDP-4-dehydrorhamnose reductase [Oryzifoliimicrobium ureilyticus]|uniref:dTDP-4-dehydrorhamnose reductase n=1 Tax=Oryzifoliimicrobium ureilyticus TaxID=3113724 RepID=UPI0030766249